MMKFSGGGGGAGGVFGGGGGGMSWQSRAAALSSSWRRRDLGPARQHTIMNDKLQSAVTGQIIIVCLMITAFGLQRSQMRFHPV